MELVNTIKAIIGRRILAGRLKSRKRSPVVCTIHEAQNIGIIYNATEYVSFEIIRELVKRLSRDGTRIMVLGYVHSKELIDHYLYRKGFDFFSTNDLNWYFKPVSSVTEQFVNEPFDLLINLSLQDYYPIHYITALSPATFKAGRYSPDDEYLDFMIDIEKEKRNMNSVQQEIMKDAHKSDLDVEIEADVNKKTETEMQLNFLINQLIHYLSILKK